MAAGHLTCLSSIPRLVLRTTQSRTFGQTLSVPVHYGKKTFFSPFLIVRQGRPFHASRYVKEAEQGKSKTPLDAEKPSGPQASQSKTSPLQNKSFSVLKYIKRSIPLSVKFDVPIGNFSTGSAKDMGKNLGNASRSKTSVTEFLSFRELVSTPSSFMFYGLSGLIPFTSVPIYMHITSSYCSSLAFAQLVYGACILSFLGGVSWGVDLLNSKSATFRSLGYSILLPLVSWAGVLVYPSVIAFPIMISGVAFAGYVDTIYQSYPSWFKNLRLLLTSLVVLSLFSTFVFSFTKKDKKISLSESV